MNKKKIKLSTSELLMDFVDICVKYIFKYDCSVKIHHKDIGMNLISLMGCFGLFQDKELEVQIIGSNKSVISSFIKDMKKFEV